MRFLYLLLTLVLLPAIGFAQRDFTPGTYELTNGTKGEGELKYKSGSGAELVVKSGPKNKKASFAPEEVKSFRAASKNFVSVHDFTLDSGMPMSMKFRVKHDFAEVLDTGRVELLSYTLIVANGRPGSMSLMNDNIMTGLILLRRRGESLSSVPAVAKKARPIIATFIKDRPDLVARLNKESYTSETVRSIIQAYNSEPKR